VGKGLCRHHYDLAYRESRREEFRRSARARYWKHRAKYQARARRYARAHREQYRQAAERYSRKKGIKPWVLAGPRKGRRYRGVTFHNQSRRYLVHVRKDGRVYSFGLHATPEEAALAYNKAVKKLYGDTPHFLNDVPSS
jgi:hypothetical protein